MQPISAYSPILLMEELSVISKSSGQLLKVYAPISKIPLPSVTDLSDVQLLNILCPSVVTVSGITISSSAIQSIKARCEIVLTRFPNTTVLRDSHP